MFVLISVLKKALIHKFTRRTQRADYRAPMRTSLLHSTYYDNKRDYRQKRRSDIQDMVASTKEIDAKKTQQLFGDTVSQSVSQSVNFSLFFPPFFVLL